MTGRAPMTDDELARFLGIADEPNCAKFIANLTPERRALFEKGII